MLADQRVTCHRKDGPARPVRLGLVSAGHRFSKRTALGTGRLPWWVDTESYSMAPKAARRGARPLDWSAAGVPLRAGHRRTSERVALRRAAVLYHGQEPAPSSARRVSPWLSAAPG